MSRLAAAPPVSAPKHGAPSLGRGIAAAKQLKLIQQGVPSPPEPPAHPPQARPAAG